MELGGCHGILDPTGMRNWISSLEWVGLQELGGHCFLGHSRGWCGQAIHKCAKPWHAFIFNINMSFFPIQDDERYRWSKWFDLL